MQAAVQIPKKRELKAERKPLPRVPHPHAAVQIPKKRELKDNVRIRWTVHNIAAVQIPKKRELKAACQNTNQKMR